MIILGNLFILKTKKHGKKTGELIDVTMGAYDGAEICELVGLFILFKFQQLNKIKNFGLYRDDGLAAVKHMSGPHSKNVKKELQILFKKFCLNLIIECNKATVDYHKESNHPSYIIKQFQITIETRPSNHSSNKTIFCHAAEDYEKALKN